MYAILPHAQASSEFQGYTGDCVMNAMLMALHGRWPWRYPLDAATLDAIVRECIAHYGAGPEGQWSADQMVVYLADHGISCRKAAFAQTADGITHELMPHAGQQGAVLGCTNAQALPGNESGVHNHGFTLFGVDDTSGVWLCGNGDAMGSNPYAIQHYTTANLLAAQLDTITWIEGPMLEPTDPIVTRYYTPGPGGWALTRNLALGIHGGMLAYYRNLFSPGDGGGVDMLGLPLGNERPAGPSYVLNGATVQPTYQDFEMGRLIYDPGHQIEPGRPGGSGSVYPAHCLSS